MQITLITLFPEYFSGVLQTSMLKRALDQTQLEVNFVDPRQFTQDVHRTVDDRPYGGGAGMLMKIEPIAAALDSLGVAKGQPNSKIILTSAKGRNYTQQTARDYSKLEKIVIICGHYEGVDERVAEHLVDEEIRVGDYVLTGGEPAAAIILDSVTRLIPGVLGNQESIEGESHDQPGLLGYPQYTRPEVFNGWSVPTELLSGDHQKIIDWRESHRAVDDESSVQP